jgi:5-methylcytosine-specific restriction endonuclease McrA
MKKHIKNYYNHHSLGIDDVIICEKCNNKKAVDIHHIIFRSQGGSDNIDNLIALCRDCHNKAHADKEFNNKLKGIIKNR